jgi:hypothetical protein
MKIVASIAHIKSLPETEKQEMLASARIADYRPGEQEFWAEVEARMKVRENQTADRVVPRPGKKH